MHRDAEHAALRRSVDIDVEDRGPLKRAIQDSPHATGIFFQDQNIAGADKRHRRWCVQAGNNFLDLKSCVVYRGSDGRSHSAQTQSDGEPVFQHGHISSSAEAGGRGAPHFSAHLFGQNSSHNTDGQRRSSIFRPPRIVRVARARRPNKSVQPSSLVLFAWKRLRAGNDHP
jgi:hypothetical protein